MEYTQQIQDVEPLLANIKPALAQHLVFAG